MEEQLVLGIDAGGTHTDAVLLECSGISAGKTLPRARLLAAVKVKTRHENLTASVREVLAALAAEAPKGILSRISRVTLGATLAVNALVQDRVDPVGLILSAGPGLNPGRWRLGEYVCLLSGGLDHRGVEVVPLRTEGLAGILEQWRGDGVSAVACVGKFSPRNAAHEQAMAEAVRAVCDLPITLGHRLSGRLNFPRRVATAFFNAAVERLHNDFLNAVEQALSDVGIQAAVRLLKADGGAVPLSLSRQEPVQSILSGPAASVMGVLALDDGDDALRRCCLLLDMGGTTTDIALFVNGSPVVDRDGMRLKGRRTLVRSLASLSIGVGGDSRLEVTQANGKTCVHVGPLREGPAMAFGGDRATLLDAFNVCNAGDGTDSTAGDIAASTRGMTALASQHGMEPEALARLAVENAFVQVAEAVSQLTAGINARPIYTLAALKAVREAQPESVKLVGGPAGCVANRLSSFLKLPVTTPAHADVANAVGAALTLPTDALELYVDTGRRSLDVPMLDLHERIDKNFGVEAASERARQLLRERLTGANVAEAHVEVTEADVFATLDDHGYGSRDIRVTCQVVPGIAAMLAD
ncbi:MAG: hydantoinase/oxoprolinase family protein [Desulfovibrio sp.]|nr:hydantoinase/oxoprolinase family protein [Desulfovibrio sp.]